jgi:para-aminobenzoate synthetase / 4-amino-4-deoxychorismate lyase
MNDSRWQDTGFALLYCETEGRWQLFNSPHDIIEATSVEEVLPALRKVEAATTNGCYAAGFLAYEAAPAFDPALATHSQSPVPLLWFGIYDDVDFTWQPAQTGQATDVTWTTSVPVDRYQNNVLSIKDEIQSGNTYQVNYSMRLSSDDYRENPFDAFVSRAQLHPAPYAAFINIGEHIIASHSPELFFRYKGRQVTCKPMKGTSPRGRSAEEDQTYRTALQNSVKDRAENLMIVDMIRNDLGRIAEPGSIKVAQPFAVETYQSLFQMTTTVTATSQASLCELFAALFPSASITGAPKVNTMKIIHALEPEARGIYTGSIGFVNPDSTAQFNVAIRTLDIEPKTNRAVYGTGSGIVWDSEPLAEYAECVTKTRIIGNSNHAFSLLETMRWTAEEGYYLLDYHLRRLADSARHFAFSFDETAVASKLASAAEAYDAPMRIRLTLTSRGDIDISNVDLPESRLLRVSMATQPIDSRNDLLLHKTTERAIYNRALAQAPDCDDVILINQAGEITESCIANVVVVRDGVHLTPALSCGLLPGTYRQYLLDQGELEEACITAKELAACDEVYLINSVRGKMAINLTTQNA